MGQWVKPLWVLEGKALEILTLSTT